MHSTLFLFVITMLYLFITGYLGYLGYRNTRTATDYMVAGRNAHPAIMALSYGATFISTSAIVGFGGAAGMFGMSVLWLTVLNITVGIFIAFVFIGKRTRAMGHRLNAHTFPELVAKRFGSPFLGLFSSLVIIGFMPLYTSVVLMGAAKFIEVRLSVQYETALLFFSAIVALYVIMGGLKGVMYTDAAQGGIMLLGMSSLLFLAYFKLGGITPAHEQLTALAPKAVELFGAAGHRGWTSMPEFGSRFWWIVISTLVMGVGIGVLAQPQLAVRFMTVKSDMELNRAVLVGGVFILLMTGTAFTVGALANVYFFNESGQIAFLAANKDIEQIIPEFLKRFMPFWIGDIFFVTLMAAAMSTASGQFHVMGTSVGRDLFATFGKELSSGASILANRIGILITLIASVLLAYILPVYFESGIAIVARGTAIFMGLCAATFLPFFVGGLYTKRITRTAAIVGGLAGFIVSLLWILFVHEKESSVLLLCNAVFGRPSFFGNARTGFIIWSEVDALFVGLPVSAVITFVLSFCTKALPVEHIRRCFGQEQKEAPLS
ncbi:MAG TPA: sodium:solute symporter family protein [Candidatus Hydrogenedentes bacterium]|jgi:SSS family solute:Na+ symporter|nr:MAG: Sodium/proline symporter [Candidatus Hydrogenedentes bacterium ADurb.Bin170]HOD96171.1 sodium:solute symporter family protein [Candidatus Hydrogenedentota bacterium]HOH42338.1 sodium:solute symporter family protein [Candidatus Hydrogenedentota bacterium]HOM48680.1 sodium:solute symporter family protein [Candidatus Hydrogenedentota bacterium]HOR51818.1 sodium:solute symporter family protein [Candidatus Hydrogenedentota bacterium]